MMCTIYKYDKFIFINNYLKRKCYNKEALNDNQ